MAKKNKNNNRKKNSNNSTLTSHASNNPLINNKILSNCTRTISKINSANQKKNITITKIYKCKSCGKRYFYRKNLFRHEREKHSRNALKKCQYCYKYYPRIKEHILRCKFGIFSKIYCMSEKNKIYRIPENKKSSQLINIRRVNFTVSVNNTQLNSRIKEKYKLTKTEIGKGCFGKVYIGLNNSNNKPVAMKFLNEKVNLKSFNKEVNFLKELGDEKYFPKIFYSQYDEQNKIIIQSLLGPNLKQLLLLCGGSFPLNTILTIFIDLLKRLEVMHSHGILHRDINPKNVVFCNFSTLNNDEKDALYLIDYGLATKFIGD